MSTAPKGSSMAALKEYMDQLEPKQANFALLMVLIYRAFTAGEVVGLSHDAELEERARNTILAVAGCLGEKHFDLGREEAIKVFEGSARIMAQTADEVKAVLKGNRGALN